MTAHALTLIVLVEGGKDKVLCVSFTRTRSATILQTSLRNLAYTSERHLQ